MAVHWVNYDLNKVGQNYDDLITYLKSHDSWCRPVKSSFLVKTTLNTAQLRDGINKHIDANDQTLVIEVTSQHWASYGQSTTVNDWLKANIVPN